MEFCLHALFFFWYEPDCNPVLTSEHVFSLYDGIYRGRLHCLGQEQSYGAEAQQFDRQSQLMERCAKYLRGSVLLQPKISAEPKLIFSSYCSPSLFFFSFLLLFPRSLLCRLRDKSISTNV